MMNFKTLKKVGLSALLVGTFAFGADESSAAAVLKGSEAVTMTAKRAGRKMTAKQADMKMKRIFAEQEKLLDAEKKKLWETFKSHSEFDLILPEIKLNMDITKIYETTTCICVPFEMCESINKPEFPKAFRKDIYKTIDRQKGGCAGLPLRVAIHYFVNEDYIVPAHDVPDFIKYNADCYFYTPKAELNQLSEQEQDYIKILDKALNTIYHHIYGDGFAKIDVNKLAKGEMAGWVYDVHKLSTRFGKDLNSSSNFLRNNMRKSFSHWLEGRSDLELKFYDILGYPLSMKDYAKASLIQPIFFEHFGGCEGEINYSMQYGSQFGIPWGKDISKDQKALYTVLGQIGLRQTNSIMWKSEQLDKKIETILKENVPNATPKFQQLLQEKVKTVHLFNKKLYSRAERIKSWKLPTSIAATGILDPYIKRNYDQKRADEKASSKAKI